MAMTKAEKAIVQSLRERAALTLPPYERPKPMPVISGAGLTVGWHMNAWSGEVAQGCFMSHAHSRFSTTKTDSQGPHCFYATKLEALRALRWEKTNKVMSELAAIDARVEAEEISS